jgi:hypothetical protein
MGQGTSGAKAGGAPVLGEGAQLEAGDLVWGGVNSDVDACIVPATTQDLVNFARAES